MEQPEQLYRVFWPLNASPSHSAGVLVGWRNSDRDIFVVAILEDVEVRIFNTFEELD
jgi:phosphatidylinositol glycan class Q protein